jgi:pimeloyl-ACP methyl ester carboxylesterase
MPSVWHRLGELTMPVVLVNGSEDTKFDKLNERAAAVLPNARHVRFDGAGHTAHLELPLAARALLGSAA